MVRCREGSLSLTAMVLAVLCSSAAAGEFDPYLSAKAATYQEWIETWHTGDLGGLTGAVTFTDQSYTELACVHYQGDSTIWTGMYLGAQALRLMATGDPAARAEVRRIATYLHHLMEITDTPGYIGRYAGIDEFPYNCGVGDDNDWKVHGTGVWEGYYWIDHTSRDQYSGWMWGMGLAHEALAGGGEEDETLRATIRGDLAAVIQMLVDNDWHITDQNGEWTGNGAHWVGPLKRLAWLLTAAVAIDDDYHWNLLREQYRIVRPALAVETSAFYNRYAEYFGNNLRHLDYQAIFRWWPDRRGLLEFWDLWMKHNRPWVAGTHNAWFDAVHVSGCRRLDLCADELDAIAADVRLGLEEYWDPPSYRRHVTPPPLDLDPFSVWMNDFLNEHPEFREIINIRPQTWEAHHVRDRCWTDMLWQSPPFHIACSEGDDPTFVGGGYDFLVSYWMAVYYGLVPGPGPIPDAGFGGVGDTDDDDAEDDDAPPASGDGDERIVGDNGDGHGNGNDDGCG